MMRDAANDVCVCSRSAGVPCPQRRLGIRGCAQRGLWPQTLCPTRIPPEYVSPGLYKRIQFVGTAGVFRVFSPLATRSHLWPAHLVTASSEMSGKISVLLLASSAAALNLGVPALRSTMPSVRRVRSLPQPRASTANSSLALSVSP